ncbi:hypothetical protein JCM10213_003307 [Rhodosporidiobolus nylandii]
MPSSPHELAEGSARELIDPRELAPPGPVLDPLPGPIPREQPVGKGKAAVPSFQELTDSSGSEEDEEDWESWVKAAEEQFTEQQIATMHDYLRERGLFAFLKRYLDEEDMAVSQVLLAMGVMVRPETPLNDQIRALKVACSRILRNREKLEAFNTPHDVVSLIQRSKKILVLTGAGVSTSCGIPDFRSPTGLYARLKEEHWELDDPQDMFDLPYFKEKPNVFYSFAKEIYPSNFVPSPCHRFVKLLEMNDKLLRNYTQNIDGLFEQVGVERMLNCHGSFATASCLTCKRRFPGSAIEADVFASRVPLCPYCTAEQDEATAAEAEEPPRKKKKKQHEWEDDSDDEAADNLPPKGEWEGKALIKPDIVFFGEALSDEFDRRLLEDRDEVDLLIVMGTSLRVSPVAQLPSHLPHSIPQVLINRDPVAHHQFDVCLLGDGDTVVQWLCDELGKLEASGGGGGKEKKPKGPREVDEKQWELDARVPVHPPQHPLPPAAAASTSAAAAAVAAASPASSKPDIDDPPPPIPSLPAAHPGAETPFEPEQVGESHVWLFPGANREARWVQAVREAYEEHEEDGEGRDESGEGEREGSAGEDGEVELPASLAPGEQEGLTEEQEAEQEREVAAEVDAA